MKEFLKTTIIGATSFLLPAALVLFILSYALRLVKRLAAPISHSLKLDQLGDLAGIGAATVLSVLVLVLISFAAGIAARTAIGGRISRWSETSLLGRLPHYQLIKSMAEGLAHIESASGLKPALVSIEDGWQIGYLLENWKTTGSRCFCRRPRRLCRATSCIFRLTGCDHLTSQWFRPCRS